MHICKKNINICLIKYSVENFFDYLNHWFKLLQFSSQIQKKNNKKFLYNSKKATILLE